MKNVSEEEIKLCERYASALETINKYIEKDNWGPDDVELAENYLSTLKAIKESEVTIEK